MSVIVGKQLLHNTYAIYVDGCRIVDVVCGVSREYAGTWAKRNYGPGAYVMENVQARDITW